MIGEKILQLQAKIDAIAESCGRTRSNIRLVAVSKRFPPEAIEEAQSVGQILFGENYLQEAQEKFDSFAGKVQFHFIGHLQSNKAVAAARICTMIETVDRIKLARILNTHLLKENKQLDILVQVNIAKDSSKAGVSPENAEELLATIKDMSGLRPRGLMTMPPFCADPEDSRIYFRDLRLLSEYLAEKKLFHDNSNVELSMGMTSDFHVAIEEGATLVRIGTAIFGERSSKTT